MEKEDVAQDRKPDNRSLDCLRLDASSLTEWQSVRGGAGGLLLFWRLFLASKHPIEHIFFRFLHDLSSPCGLLVLDDIPIPESRPADTAPLASAPGSLWLRCPCRWQSTPSAPRYPRATPGTVSIDQFQGYADLRQCAKGCLQNNHDSGRDLGDELGCRDNGCYCGTSYGVDVESYLRSCISSSCSTSGAEILNKDISAAQSVYNAYCNQNSGQIPATTPKVSPASLAADTLVITVQDSASPVVGPTVFITSTRTRQISSSPSLPVARSSTRSPATDPATATATATAIPISKPTGLSTSDKIALGCGLGVGLPTFLVTLWAACVKCLS